jgi:hypothetical protein
MSGYTNGRMAYMATAVEWPKGGYEVENSPFGERAAETLEKEILKTLAEMRSEARKNATALPNPRPNGLNRE